LEDLVLVEFRVDGDDNAYGFIPGAVSGKKVLVEGHLDTVFDEDTPLSVTEKDGRLYCPGIGDDTAALALLLSVLRAIRHADLNPVYTLMAGGTSGEEGEGDIRGIKAMLRDNPALTACLALEPGDAGLITKSAIGSRRYEFIFTGPGGHSWSAYGLPSPIHAMGRAIAKMAAVGTPENPRTTYTVGVVGGGTSVNSIANRASCKLDMRSAGPEALSAVETVMLGLVREAVEEENAFRAASGGSVAVENKLIGDRPAGNQPDDAPIVQASWAVHEALGVSPKIGAASSTNANAPISKGIPALVVRTGGASGGVHTLDEWFDPNGMHLGAQATLLLLFALAGLQGVCDPLKLHER
jgi:acetylornithine deacetylase/succinyl-diaminopimelate desuccinylase-like protein